MNISISNVPLRSDAIKTSYPPIGAMAIIQALRGAGYDADFFDINYHRPSDEKIREYLQRNKFDVLGISAPVSTSYKFVRKLVTMTRSISPQTVLVVGGAITSASEVLLSLNDIDFCVIGEGERVIVNLMRYIKSYKRHKDENILKGIRGICFKSEKGKIVFTGYEKELPAEKIEDADYGILDKHSNVDQYIVEPSYYVQFKHDERTFAPHRKGKRLATVVSSRGCINRCAFCYRWQRGIRVFSVDKVIGHVRHLMGRYNVGFVSFGDENFGVSKKWVDEFIEKIKSLDILYRIAGICCENVNPALLTRLKESGCVAIHYGFESGSNRMLKVMEKRADVTLNEQTALWTHEAGLQTVPALVVGLPGESYSTIGETTDFVKRITKIWDIDPLISPNALIALPGTPVYEYARYRGLLGRTLNDEENYLLTVSDQSGSSLRHLNVTDYPYFVVLGWIRCICWGARYHYYKTHRKSQKKAGKTFRERLYGNPFFYHLRYVIAPLVVMYKSYRDDKELFLRRSFELLAWPFKKKAFTRYTPLRTFLKERMEELRDIGPEDIKVLRLGR